MGILCIDVGGTFIKTGLLSSGATLSRKQKYPTPKKWESFTACLQDIKQDIGEEIAGISMSIPGIVDSDRGYLQTGGSLMFNYGREIVRELEPILKTRIIVENDGKCAALAEARDGSLKNCKNGIVLIIGTAIGGGIIANQQLLKGSHFAAGEFSYIQTPAGFFGNVNSAIDLGGELALEKNSKIPYTGEEFFEFLKNKDRQAHNIMTNYAKGLAEQLFNLQVILDPEKIAIGGGISHQPLLFDYLEAHKQKLIQQYPMYPLSPCIVPCSHRGDANLIGAYYNFLDKK